MNRAEFQKLSDLRLHESKALLTAGLPQGAYYLAGYAVECALKACIAKRTGYSELDAALKNVGIRFPGLPPVALLPMKRPFIQALRDLFGSAQETYGMRLGNQSFGDEYVEDAFVYRIR
jgi:hypothetical protein